MTGLDGAYHPSRPQRRSRSIAARLSLTTDLVRRAVLRIASLAGDPRTILAAAVGAGVALVPLAAWFAQTRGAGHYFFAMWENTIVLGFALTEAVKLVLAYAVIGSLVGLWVAFSFRRSRSRLGAVR